MANNKKRKPNTERHKERKTSTTEMTRTLYFIITTLNYMEREVERERGTRMPPRRQPLETGRAAGTCASSIGPSHAAEY